MASISMDNRRVNLDLVHQCRFAKNSYQIDRFIAVVIIFAAIVVDAMTHLLGIHHGVTNRLLKTLRWGEHMEFQKNGISEKL